MYREVRDQNRRLGWKELERRKEAGERRKWGSPLSSEERALDLSAVDWLVKDGPQLAMAVPRRGEKRGEKKRSRSARWSVVKTI